MKTLCRFRAKSTIGSVDIERGNKNLPPPPQTYKCQKSPALIGLTNINIIFPTLIPLLGIIEDKFLFKN